MTTAQLTFEDIKAQAEAHGIGCARVPGFDRYCLLDLPSRISPPRRLPPLLFSTAAEVLDEIKT